jgi:hypothetical protein
MDTEGLAAKLRRKANRIVVGGFRPPDSPQASWFGRVRLASPDEEWPYHQTKPMLPLCQLNLTEMDYVPPSLSDLSLITVFISSVSLPIDTENGDGWRLRSYTSLEGLVEIEAPGHDRLIHPFPVRWELIEADYPSYEDIPCRLPGELLKDYSKLFPNHYSSKVGGWPYLIQSEIYWAPYNNHPANPEYVFQIGSEEKAHWQWGDSGIGYFGRGTGRTRDVWALSWQCY